MRFKRIDFNPAHWDFVELETDGKCEEIVRTWFHAHEGRRYNLIIGGFGLVFRPVAGSLGSWFCSEAVAEALGFRDSWRISPNLLAALLKGWKW